MLAHGNLCSTARRPSISHQQTAGHSWPVVPCATRARLQACVSLDLGWGAQAHKLADGCSYAITQAHDAMEHALYLRSHQGRHAEPGGDVVWPLDAFALEASFAEGMQLYPDTDWQGLDVVSSACTLMGVQELLSVAYALKSMQEQLGRPHLTRVGSCMQLYAASMW